MLKLVPSARGSGLSFLALMALAAVFALAAVGWSAPPLEDAAMLMRYAEHLSLGYGIVWNIGEPPVDGETDFLLTILVAAVRSTGISLEAATRLVAISAHFATVGLIYIGMRRVQRSGIIPAFLSGAYFAVGPGLFLAAAYFGTPLFTFAVAATWLLAQRVMFADERRTRDYVFFALAGLASGLTRPEGVLVSILMLLSLAVVLPAPDFRQLAVPFAAVWLLLGGTYFIWHWAYFGHPLPNPFYVKGGGRLYPGALQTSVRNSAKLLFPFIPAFILSARSWPTLRLGIAFCIPILGSIGMWVLLSDEMNFGGRFQYSVLAIGVLSWYPLVKSLRGDFGLPRLSSLSRGRQLGVILPAALCVTAVFATQVRYSTGITYQSDSRYDVAIALSHFGDRKYTLATTEAGLLPLYSQWRAVDTWGLNDEWIAHNGGVTPQYLAQQNPDVIVFHDVPSSPLGPRWNKQVDVLRGYAETHHFTLAAAFGVSPEDTMQYYVRPDTPDHDRIVHAIRSVDYAAGQGGAVNFMEWRQ